MTDANSVAIVGMTLRSLVGAGVVGYLAGTVPSADIVARRVSRGSIDLRTTGTGNPGGANAMNVLGRRAGLTVMGADIAKGFIASNVGRVLAGAGGGHVAGTASVVGHCFPVWRGFRGGKGVGASAGQCLATFPAYFPIDLAVAAVTASVPWWKRRAFAATGAASACWVFFGLVWWVRRLPNLWGPKPGPGLPLASAASSAIILYRFAAARPPTAVRGATP